MKKHWGKRLLLITPIFILLVMLVFINHAVDFFENTAYTFVYNTNVESVRRFSKEIKELDGRGYTGEAYTDFYDSMIFVYSKTLGEKDAIITFLLDDNSEIYHSNAHNEEYLSTYLNSQANMNLIKDVAGTHSNGSVELRANGDKSSFYYHYVVNGTVGYYLFMGVNKADVEAELNVNEIIIPICVIGLLLLIITEYALWTKVVCIISENRKREGSDAD